MFLTDTERKRLGGTCFIEFQYCRLPAGTPLPKLVSVRAIRSRKAGSLYVSGDDQNDFFEAYKDILTGWLKAAASGSGFYVLGV